MTTMKEKIKSYLSPEFVRVVSVQNSIDPSGTRFYFSKKEKKSRSDCLRLKDDVTGRRNVAVLKLIFSLCVAGKCFSCVANRRAPSLQT